MLIRFNGLNYVCCHLRQLYGFRNIQYDVVPIDIVFKGKLSDQPGVLQGNLSEPRETVVK